MLVLPLQFSSTAASAGEVVKLDGYAEWRYDEFLIVEGQRVKATKGTRFSGKGAARGFDAIPLGYEVKVYGYRTPDGTVLARKVEAKPNGSALFEGQLRSAFEETEERWRRDGRAVEQGQNLGKLLRSGRDVERVRTIIDRLVPPYRRTSEFRAYVIENSAWNAMAAPNGSVFVFTGLLDAMDDDELAIIVGHELAHTTYEHSRRQFKRSLWTNLGLAAVLAVAEGSSSRGAANDCERPGGRSDVGPSLLSTGAELGALAFTNRYSRQHEDQADRVGLRYTYEAGYDVSKAPELWRKFGRKHGGQPEALNFFLGSPLDGVGAGAQPDERARPKLPLGSISRYERALSNIDQTFPTTGHEGANKTVTILLGFLGFLGWRAYLARGISWHEVCELEMTGRILATRDQEDGPLHS